MSMSEAFLCHYRFNKMSTKQSSEWLRLSLVLEFNLLCGPRIWLNTDSFHLSIGRSEETLLRKSQLSRLPRSQRGSPVAFLERASEMQGQPVQRPGGERAWRCEPRQAHPSGWGGGRRGSSRVRTRQWWGTGHRGPWGSGPLKCFSAM